MNEKEFRDFGHQVVVGGISVLSGPHRGRAEESQTNGQNYAIKQLRTEPGIQNHCSSGERCRGYRTRSRHTNESPQFSTGLYRNVAVR
jgi:hypothetical protein